MNKPLQVGMNFEAAEYATMDGEALIVDLDGYEGPLDVLLALARGQKVDLLKLSVTKLAEQYLAFVRRARAQNFALAADYLVMAAWLAYLKSRLLLPKSDLNAKGDQPAEQVAAGLALRLKKLDAMRRAAEALASRPILKRDVFVRGDPQAVRIVSHRRLEGDLYGLMDAYVGIRKRGRRQAYSPEPAQCYRLDDAREHLRGMLTDLTQWTGLFAVAPPSSAAGPTRASLVASTFSASLEMVREGDLEARQLGHFAQLYLRARKSAA